MFKLIIFMAMNGHSFVLQVTICINFTFILKETDSQKLQIQIKALNSPNFRSQVQNNRMKKQGLKYLRWIKRAITKKNVNSKACSKRKSRHQNSNKKPSPYQHRVPSTDQESFLQSIILESRPPTPIKIKLSSQLKFTYPDKIVIRVQKKQSKSQLDQIDYKDNSQNAMYIQVNAQQFLSKSYLEKPNIDSGKYSISVPQMMLRQQNYQLPHIVKQYFIKNKRPVYAVNLWHYQNKTLTKWHYDAHDNFLFQLKGKKLVKLLPPNFPSSIYHPNPNPQKKNPGTIHYISCDSVFNIDNNHANESLIQPNQLLQDPRLLVVQIREKQCLFIPKGWFHQVTSFLNSSGENVAVNCWGNTVPVYDLPIDQQEMNLKQLIYQVSEHICSLKYSDWQEMSEDSKENFRKAHFLQYIGRLSQQ